MNKVLPAVTEFLAALFDKTDLIEIRTLPAGKQSWKTIDEIDDEVISTLTNFNLDGQNIYFGVNPRTCEGGKSEDVLHGKVLFVDFDNCSLDFAREVVSSGALPLPTIEISSGHGAHFYWRLEEPILDMELWTSYMRGLIAVCESDGKVKDPARIMRMPSFLNVKSDPHMECRVEVLRKDAVYSIDDMPIESLMPIAPPPTATEREIKSGEAEPHPATLHFMKAGAKVGNRNGSLFTAACDLCGRGYTQEQANKMLIRPAMNSGLAVGEIETAIKSAFAKVRMPREEDSDTIESCMQLYVHGTDKSREMATLSGKQFRSTITNVADIGTGEESRRCYVTAPKIFEAIQEANGGFPRRVGSMLFAETDPPPDGKLPTSGAIRFITNEAAFFAYLMRKNDIRWTNRECVDKESGAKRNPASKKEMYEYASAEAMPQYRSVELLPHHPPIDGVYYPPCTLPEPTGKALKELVDHFNPETDMDRQLMLVALVTPAWGGESGTRPAFVFTSSYSRGVGKTTTASMICEIYGGAPSITEREDWEMVRARLLSDEALAQRCVLIDNLKSRLSRSGLEGAITAATIDGKKMYKGQFSRPNTLTWFITANTPSLSRDLADRSVIIKLGEAKHASNFGDWKADFLRENRAQLISDIISWLKGEKLGKLTGSHLDRWGPWQRAVLERFENCNEIAEHYQGRRPEVDSDLEEADEVALVIKNLLVENNHDPKTCSVKIPRAMLYNELKKEDIIDNAMRPKGCTTWIKNMATLSPMRCLTTHKKHGNARCWLWLGENADPDLKPIFIDYKDNEEIPF